LFEGQKIWQKTDEENKLENKLNQMYKSSEIWKKIFWEETISERRWWIMGGIK